jgi:hypothetical protein
MGSPLQLIVAALLSLAYVLVGKHHQRRTVLTRDSACTCHGTCTAVLGEATDWAWRIPTTMQT